MNQIGGDILLIVGNLLHGVVILRLELHLQDYYFTILNMHPEFLISFKEEPKTIHPFHHHEFHTTQQLK